MVEEDKTEVTAKDWEELYWIWARRVKNAEPWMFRENVEDAERLYEMFEWVFPLIIGPQMPKEVMEGTGEEEDVIE